MLMSVPLYPKHPAVKYLDRVLIVDGCKYIIDESSFSTMEQALAQVRKIPYEKRLETHGRTVTVTIENPNAPDIFNEQLIPSQLAIKDSKDVLCIYAKERQITFASDLSEVYTEYFELYRSEGLSYEHIYDYGILYGHYPVYTGKELCMSRVLPDGEDRNLTFVPEPVGKYGVDRPNAIYKRLHEVYMAYDCYFVRMEQSGNVYDDGNGAFPFSAIPVATFVNIGLAGINLDCWERITQSVDTRKGAFYSVNGKQEYLFRNALLACKERELSDEKPYYTITVKNPVADGKIPPDFSRCTAKGSWQQLSQHAQKRLFYISPSFDAVYWESFELLDCNNQIRQFQYDYALMDGTFPSLQIGATYQTSYWAKADFRCVDLCQSVILLDSPSHTAEYDGTSDLYYCCMCQKAESGKKALIPSATLRL